MVILRTDGRPPLCGLYVGESDNGVWIAVHNKNQNDLVVGRELPRATVAALAIGPTRTMTDATMQKGENEMETLRSDLSRKIQNPVQERRAQRNRPGSNDPSPFPAASMHQ